GRQRPSCFWHRADREGPAPSRARGASPVDLSPISWRDGRGCGSEKTRGYILRPGDASSAASPSGERPATDVSRRRRIHRPGERRRAMVSSVGLPVKTVVLVSLLIAGAAQPQTPAPGSGSSASAPPGETAPGPVGPVKPLLYGVIY